MFSRDYEVVPIKIEHSISGWELRSHYNDELHQHVIEAIRYYAKGSQVTVDRREKREVQVAIEVPINAWNWVKCGIVEWQPTLNFGWITPRLRTVETAVKIEIAETCYNVYPVQPEEARDRRIRFPVRVLLPTATQWLDAVPPTVSDVRAVEEEFSRKDCARLLAYQRFVNR